MGKYTIKEVEALCGIKAHTLRIWEQRYEVVKPIRTETNIRYYSDEQLVKLLNFAVLNRGGYKISKLAKLTPSEIAEKVTELEHADSPHDVYINEMVSGMVALDKDLFNNAMQKALDVYSFEKVCMDIIFPFLSRIGTLWSVGSIYPAQEHFASNLIKRKVMVQINNMVVKPIANPKKFVLFLPEGEYHELSLLISEYLVLSQGHIVYYFGSSVPTKDIEKVLEVFDVDYILSVMLVCTSREKVEESIKEIADIAAKQEIWIAGSPRTFKQIESSKNVLFFDTLPSFVEKVKMI